MNKKLIAFTLIELLVVIAIIGILSGLIIVGMNGMTNSANIAKAQVFSNSLRNSLMLNLVSEWKLDQVLGSSPPYTTPDSWSGGNTGTLYGAGGSQNLPQLQTAGCVYGNCLKFDGTDDYIDCGSGINFNSGSVSIEMWLYSSLDLNCDGENNWRSIIHKGNTSGAVNGYDVVLEENRFFAWDIGTAGGSNRWWPSDITLPLNQWTHYVFTYEASSGKMGAYKNGTPTSPNVITANPILSNGSSLMISNSSTACPAGAGSFPGNIDNVRIYNAVVPTSQIKEQYYAGLNNLLTNGSITKKEYAERMGELTMAQNRIK